MKIVWVLFFTFDAVCSVIPERMVTPPLDLFNGKNRILKTGQREIRVTSVTRDGEFFRRGAKQIISEESYLEFLRLALPVVESLPNKNGNSGSAVHIGHNLVLTNNHVLDTTFKNTTKCNGLSLKDHRNVVFNCKQVHYCNPIEDLCLIEMKQNKKEQIAQGLSHKIRANYLPQLDWDLEVMSVIGNSNALGIHFAQGRGVKILPQTLQFYAPITHGNSGGALIDSQGIVVGIVKTQSKRIIGSDTNVVYNSAIRTETVITLIRDALRDNREILSKFNESVVE